MAALQLIISIWVYSVTSFPALGSDPWCSDHLVRATGKKFEQKTDRFWHFHEQSNSWVELKLPFDLISCLNDDCTTVGTIKKPAFDQQAECLDGKNISDELFRLRKRISLRKMSETSIWVTGESGSIYERFWNGVQWVLAPHDLPISAGFAVSVFLINQTLLSLSEDGVLYQWKLHENSQPVWEEFRPAFDEEAIKEEDQTSTIQIRSGFLSRARLRLYFCTKEGTLLELNEVDPLRWSNHSRPPGADVAAIADAASFRTDVVYTISSKGDLYEFDETSKPKWKRHIWRDSSEKDVHLIPTQGCILNGLNGENSISLFLLTKCGNLVERRLYNKKWSWIRHERPNNHRLTSITTALHEESDKKLFSLFFTSSAGFVFEYRIQSHTGKAQESWVNHMHPLNAKVARGISGLEFQAGRILFALNDGRLGELHLKGIGGENSGPTHHSTHRKKASVRYVWSILDAPETEGWNGEYCNEDRGPLNCIAGTKDDLTENGMRGRMKGNQAQESYLIPRNRRKSSEEHFVPENSITGFRLRLIHGGRSFFLVTDDGEAFEYLRGEEISIWIRHESSTELKGIVGNFNGSLFLVDVFGSLLIRERIGDEFSWINGSALQKGKQIIGGPAMDGSPGLSMEVFSEDHSLFFVGKNGRLFQFRVSSRKYKWKDCKKPADTKVAAIVDQEIFRENLVFVIGRNGQLYQYNKLTELWHEHYQSRHLILSSSSGMTCRPSMQKLRGSIFMVSREGGLVEYQWNTWEGWSWIEHGKPSKEVAFVALPGLCFDSNQLFLVGSDGSVYLRYGENLSWKWRNCGLPKQKEEQVCVDQDFVDSLEKSEEDLDEKTRNCNAKVAPTRPVRFSEDSIIFELRDGRVAEMDRMEDSNWRWGRIIATPASLCTESYWTA